MNQKDNQQDVVITDSFNHVDNKKNQIKKVFKYLGYALAAVVFAYLVFYIVFNLVAPNQTVKKLGYKSYVILTESMEPKLNRGDLIMVTKGDFYNLKEGNVITFVNPRNHKDVVTHNFVRYDYEGTEIVARTKGNQGPDGGNPQLDFWKITEKDFIGVYRYHIPKIGNVIAFLQSWFGFASIVLVCAVIAGAYYMITYLKSHNEEEAEELLDEKDKK